MWRLTTHVPQLVNRQDMSLTFVRMIDSFSMLIIVMLGKKFTHGILSRDSVEG